MQLLRTEILNLLENQLDSQNMDGNAVQNGCHVQNSKPESIHELEPSSGKEQGGAVELEVAPKAVAQAHRNPIRSKRHQLPRRRSDRSNRSILVMSPDPSLDFHCHGMLASVVACPRNQNHIQSPATKRGAFVFVELR